MQDFGFMVSVWVEGQTADEAIAKVRDLLGEDVFIGQVRPRRKPDIDPTNRTPPDVSRGARAAEAAAQRRPRLNPDDLSQGVEGGS